LIVSDRLVFLRFAEWAVMEWPLVLAKRTLVNRRRVVATTQKSSKRDCGQIYGAVVHTPIACHGHSKPIAPASPWQNGFAARLIGSIRRGCVDHIIVQGEAQPFNMKRRSSA